ncbi:hypothetical protein ABW19_dt0204657 [Dactylella cylindrospora]|nr:hypothetical protein ABW19_dt0204657 [Dactylella cylindrospora]
MYSHRFALLRIITIYIAISLVSGQKNEFIFPAPYDPNDDDFSDNPILVAGSRVDVEWTTSYSSFTLYSIQGGPTVTPSEDFKLESNATNAPNATSYNWYVWTNIENPPYLPMYLVIYSSEDSTQFFRSRSFNVTNGPAPDGVAYTATEKDPSVKTTLATGVSGGSSTFSTATGTGREESVTETGVSSTAIPSPEEEAGRSSGGDGEDIRKLGLGLGLGLGIPLLALILFVGITFACGGFTFFTSNQQGAGEKEKRKGYFTGFGGRNEGLGENTTSDGTEATQPRGSTGTQRGTVDARNQEDLYSVAPAAPPYNSSPAPVVIDQKRPSRGDKVVV